MRNLFIVTVVILMCIMSYISFSYATVGNYIMKIGVFSVKVNGKDVAISASSGVVIGVSVDDVIHTNSAVVGALHRKGSYFYGVDTEYMNLYVCDDLPNVGESILVEEAFDFFPTASTGVDDFIAGDQGNWISF